MFIIERRYQWLSRDGVTWTKWFKFKKLECDKKEAEKQLKEWQKTKEANKKLLGEYRLVELDIEKGNV